MQFEEVTLSAVEAFQARLAQREHNGRRITPRTRNKVLNVLHGVFGRAKKVWGLPLNPAAELERHPDRSSGDIEVFSPEEVWALVRAADDEPVGDPGARELRRRRAERAEVRKGAIGADGRGGCGEARKAERKTRLHARGRPRVLRT